jgi:hypothetical protein
MTSSSTASQVRSSTMWACSNRRNCMHGADG